MSSLSVIVSATPTPFLRSAGAGLRQIARVAVNYSGPPISATIVASGQGASHATPAVLPTGESVIEAEVPEVSAACSMTFTLQLDGRLAATTTVAWTPPRRWVVHVVQLSHHDVGYTDLASHVLAEHDGFLDSAIEMAEATRDFPEDARFRAVIEQAWSVTHYLQGASPARAEAMLRLMRTGELELTALFGNMVTELCGHEALARCVYHAFRLKREHDIPIVSAEHNDIPGFSWGLSQVLTATGIGIFCPGLPTYYQWGNPNGTSFWDEAAIFGAQGVPGAFWWAAPSGKRVLFWSNNQGCGGDHHTDLPSLAARLQTLSESAYPYSVLRWPVGGGARDNSPYVDGYSHTICAWNERWAYPHLVSSTNARFHKDLLRQLPADLPVWRGEVPGQDYPIGAASTAFATGVNRRNHADLPAAEALATVASATTNYQYQTDRIRHAYDEMLWHDEHTWGHHFPCGPTATAAELEKAVHAHRAAALAHDVSSKAMAQIADGVHFDEPGLHLVVFNPLPFERSGVVTTPLREIDNCGSTMMRRPDGSLRGVLLHSRWHVNPPPEIVEGRFRLIDVTTGTPLPYQISEVASPLGDTPYAGQRLGLGSGGHRYGFFEDPAGLRRDLSFLAEDVPALGYRTYRLQPCAEVQAFAASVTAGGARLESPFYRLELDPSTGHVTSLVDRQTGRELVDLDAPHPFGALVVRDPHGGESITTCEAVIPGENGPVSASVRVRQSAPGHPCIEQTLTLYANEKRLDMAVHLLKDPTPLLEVYLAFPFLMPEGRFRYEGPLCVVDPERDLLPGAYADRLTAQNWVSVTGADASVLWGSREAPVVSLGRLWPGRLSPAHSAVVRTDIEHPCQGPSDLRGGTIYSLLTANNVGTNFTVSQCGALLFRYSVTSAQGAIADDRAVHVGQQLVTPFSTIFTEHPGGRSLPPSGGFLEISNSVVQLVALKRPEAGDGLIVRLWNAGDQQATTTVALARWSIASVCITNLAEEATGEAPPVGDHAFEVTLQPREVLTARVRLAECATSDDVVSDHRIGT